VTPSPFEIQGFQAGTVGPRDVALVQDLLVRCSAFHELVEGAPPRADEGARLLRDLPPRYDERFLVGLARAEGAPLAGLIDVVGGYPAPAAWWVGLLLLAPGERGRGAGATAYAAFESWVHPRGAREVGLVVHQQNARSRRFWDRLGFVETGTAVQRIDRHENVVWRMRKVLDVPVRWGS
jgi:RimJ/RimL family protein N-acetyltransferase